MDFVSIDSDNGLLPVQCQAIIWTNAGLLWIGPLGTIVSEFLMKIQNFSFMKMHPKISSAKWWPYCLGREELMSYLPALNPQGQKIKLSRKWTLTVYCMSHLMWWLAFMFDGVSMGLLKKSYFNYNDKEWVLGHFKSLEAKKINQIN